MQTTRTADLVTEVERYLAAVEFFRTEGCEPQWRLEISARPRRRRASARGRRDPLASLTRRLDE
jgi:hypothetical protein